VNIPTIVTVQQAQDHLSIPYGQQEEDLELKIAAATQLVCEYISQRRDEDEQDAWILEIESWSLGSPEAPRIVVMAILVQVGELYRFRGDDAGSDAPKGDTGEPSPLVKRLLSRYRSPSLS
jgi:hypothetical protein